MPAQRIILYALSHIRAGDREFEEVRVPISFIVNSNDRKLDGRNYTTARKATKELHEMSVDVHYDSVTEEWTTISLVGQSERRNGEPFVRIQFSDKAKPFLLELEGQYTGYMLKYVTGFKNSFSVRIYELCKQYQRIGRREMKLAFLKEILGLDHKYNRFTNFKSRVLEPAVADINDFSDIRISFEVKKRGRIIDTIFFFVSINSNQEKQSNEIYVE